MNALVAFEMSARLGGIRQASEVLCVTPGAISRQVRLIEEFFGIKLFVKHGRGIALSPEGRRYYERVTLHLDGIRDATSELTTSGKRTVLAIRSYTTFATRWLIFRLPAFQAANPEIEVRLSMDSEWRSLENLDAAIRLGEGNWPELDAVQLVPNKLIVVCSPQTLEQSGVKSPRDLAGQSLLGTRHRPDDWRIWMNAAGTKSFSFHQNMTFESSALAYQAALSGMGFAIAQEVLVEEDLKSKRLVAPFDVTVDRGNHTYYLVANKNSPKIEAVRLLAKWLSGSHDDR